MRCDVSLWRLPKKEKRNRGANSWRKKMLKRALKTCLLKQKLVRNHQESECHVENKERSELVEKSVVVDSEVLVLFGEPATGDVEHICSSRISDIPLDITLQDGNAENTPSCSNARVPQNRTSDNTKRIWPFSQLNWRKWQKNCGHPAKECNEKLKAGISRSDMFTDGSDEEEHSDRCKIQQNMYLVLEESAETLDEIEDSISEIQDKLGEVDSVFVALADSQENVRQCREEITDARARMDAILEEINEIPNKSAELSAVMFENL